MGLRIPLTGTVEERDAEGRFSGNADDPIRIIDIDIGDIAWQAISFDLDNGFVEVEADVPKARLIKLPGKPARYGHELSQVELDDINQGRVIPGLEDEPEAQYQARRTQILNNARQLLEGHTVDELYQMSGSPRLRFKEK